MARISATLLNGVTENGAGNGVETDVFRRFAANYHMEDFSSGGATVEIQTKIGDDWVRIDYVDITEDGDTPVQFFGLFPWLRAVVSNYVDGTITVSVNGAD